MELDFFFESVVDLVIGFLGIKWGKGKREFYCGEISRYYFDSICVGVIL